MSILAALRSELGDVGYRPEAIVSDYVFSDVFASQPIDRSAAIAAFTQTPPSYRNAALGVVRLEGRAAEEVVDEYRALGAPLLLLLSGSEVSVWQVRSDRRPVVVARGDVAQVSSLFQQYRGSWNPQAIQRAKAVGLVERSYQLEFVDVGLLPAVEGQVHARLDRLVSQIVADLLRLHIPERPLFRTVFRLLAAKVLLDRKHAISRRWNPDDTESVLRAIADYYSLGNLPDDVSRTHKNAFSSAWRRLRSAINCSNISADDLAFVYENTLITEETREHFGTHSTPRSVADFVVARLGLWNRPLDEVRVYEPFAGAGVFLVAALRHLRELLPTNLDARQRHRLLIDRLEGDELDAFAREVAVLSLILADYPNANGWRVRELDLMQSNTLLKRARTANVILCNPPFEAFTPAERTRYPEMVERSTMKAAAVLSAVLEAAPEALGFVLPRAILDERRFLTERVRLERSFSEIDLVSLPEHVFAHSGVETALVVARAPRVSSTRRGTMLKCTTVTSQDRDMFLATGWLPQEPRARTQPYPPSEPGRLWVTELEELWHYLADYPRLGSVVSIHRGLEWTIHQNEATSPGQRLGYQKGLASADSVQQFVVARPTWLDTRDDDLRRAQDLPWNRPKLILNAVRLGRGEWRLAGAVDTSGLVFSQQLFGCWPIQDVDLLSVAAVLNGPLANAFVTEHSPGKSFRVSALSTIPIPPVLAPRIRALVVRYIEAVSSEPFELGSARRSDAALRLNEIDAEVLRAYDVPPRLEKRLLERFRGEKRPVVHTWEHWLPPDFDLAVPLHEFLSGQFSKATGNWVISTFKPLPSDEADLLREYMD